MNWTRPPDRRPQPIVAAPIPIQWAWRFGPDTKKPYINRKMACLTPGTGRSLNICRLTVFLSDWIGDQFKHLKPYVLKRAFVCCVVAVRKLGFVVDRSIEVVYPGAVPFQVSSRE